MDECLRRRATARGAGPVAAYIPVCLRNARLNPGRRDTTPMFKIVEAASDRNRLTSLGASSRARSPDADGGPGGGSRRGRGEARRGARRGRPGTGGASRPCRSAAGDDGHPVWWRSGLPRSTAGGLTIASRARTCRRTCAARRRSGRSCLLVPPEPVEKRLQRNA